MFGSRYNLKTIWGSWAYASLIKKKKSVFSRPEILAAAKAVLKDCQVISQATALVRSSPSSLAVLRCVCECRPAVWSGILLWFWFVSHSEMVLHFLNFWLLSWFILTGSLSSDLTSLRCVKMEAREFCEPSAVGAESRTPVLWNVL